MSDSSRRPFRFALTSGLIVACLVTAGLSARVFAQTPTRSYQVLSSSASEVVIKIAPKFEYNTVTGTDGKSYTEVRFAGGSILDSVGAREAQKLILPLLAPSHTPVSIEVVDQKLDVRANVDLAPVPSYVGMADGYKAVYSVQPDRYISSNVPAPFVVEPATVMRTAYMQRLVVSPVIYDPISRSLTLVRSMTLRVRFDGAIPKAADVSKSEAGFFQTIFVNGATREFYRAAENEINVAHYGQKGAKALGAASSGQWLMVETTDEGVYRISAQDLQGAGISGAIDPNTIELFGVGGAILSEDVTSRSGDWVECPIELHANGGNLQNFYFYAAGTTQWKYSYEPGLKADGIYHTMNPYAERGHFLLKVGGERLAAPARIVNGADSLHGTTEVRNYVLSAITHEIESQMEHQNNWGHEFLGEKIPRSDVDPLEFSMNPPGYLPDSTTMHVGYDASVPAATGSVALSVDGQNLSTLSARASGPKDPAMFRNWDNATRVPAGLSSPLRVDLSFTSDAPTANARLDFIELIYRRSLNIGSTQIPFFIVDTLHGNNHPISYSFQNGAGGAVWDVTSFSDPVSMGSAEGDGISVTLQPRAYKMRKFIAFSQQSLRAATLSRIAAPSLRESLGDTGVEEIILAPTVFLGPANELKQLRQKGGEATEPLTVDVVNIDSVYREFGYGNKDITAVRDFMAYTFRHGATKVHYLLLFGNGHCDYLNRSPVGASIPNWIPPFEVDPFPGLTNYRVYIPTDEYPYPDDGYFVRLDSSHNDGGHTLDAAVGRVSAQTLQDAEVFVAKTQQYEHGSDPGAWRSFATFLADDRIAAADETDCDGINHLGDSESEEQEVPGRMLIHKIYDVSYPRVQTSTGPHQPDVEQAIISAINDGTVMFSFVGHGNPNVWTHEGVLSVPSTLNRFTNFDRLSYFTTATCDFSEFDNFAAAMSGGVRLLLQPNGGAIGLLGTSRSVFGGDALLNGFYQGFLDVSPESGLGSGSAGDALILGKIRCNSFNLPIYYILGDPAQRLLVPKRYIAYDSIGGATIDSNGTYQLPALSQAKIAGHIVKGNGKSLEVDADFNGTVTVTLFDAPVQQHATTICPVSGSIRNDAYWVEGPILYRGTATVRNGAFSVAFIVPKDVRFDTMNAKISGYAYSEDGHSALGVEQKLRLMPPPPEANVTDTTAPSLALYIGSRNFHSGDAVSKHTTAIVDVSAKHGLNTSTASVGHSFIVWVDDVQDSAFDMAPNYVSKQDDYTVGSSTRRVELPAGHHTLHVRAFDAFNNPSFTSVEFVAKNEDPYRLYEVTNRPNPLIDHTTFSFTQPGGSGSLVEITLSIYTTDARLERTITMQTRESTIDIPWDGRDDAGTTVSNGVHIFTINARNLDDGTSTQATGKCVVAR